MTEIDTKEDEIIDVKMPRKDYKVLREIVEREKTFNWVVNWVRSGWVLIVASAGLLVVNFWDALRKVF